MKKKLFRERQEDSSDNFLEDFLGDYYGIKENGKLVNNSSIKEPTKEVKEEEPKLVKKKRKVAKK